MAVGKTDRSARARPAAPLRDAPEVVRNSVRTLGLLAGTWEAIFRHCHHSPVEADPILAHRAKAVSRIVKAAFAALVSADDDALDQLEKPARKYLAKTPHRSVDASRFAPDGWPGWQFPVADVVPEKGRPDGRPADLRMQVGAVERALREAGATPSNCCERGANVGLDDRY